MILRACQRWLMDLNPGKRRSRCPLEFSGAELLEKWFVPAIAAMTTDSISPLIPRHYLMAKTSPLASMGHNSHTMVAPVLCQGQRPLSR